MHQTPDMTRLVALDFLAANQAIAALDDRIAWLRCHEDTAAEAAQAHRAVAAIRTAWDVWPRSEAQLDAAHEVWAAEMTELADADLPDVPLADWAPGEITEAWGR